MVLELVAQVLPEVEVVSARLQIFHREEGHLNRVSVVKKYSLLGLALSAGYIRRIRRSSDDISRSN
jgi:hypothetical protein